MRRQRFCSDLCRKRSFRKAQQDEQKEARRVYREASRHPRTYTEMDASDPRMKLAKLKANGILSEEYWSLFRECDLQFNGGSAVVNGISTKLELFASAVVMSIEELGIVTITRGKAE